MSLIFIQTGILWHLSDRYYNDSWLAAFIVDMSQWKAFGMYTKSHRLTGAFAAALGVLFCVKYKQILLASSYLGIHWVIIPMGVAAISISYYIFLAK